MRWENVNNQSHRGQEVQTIQHSSMAQDVVSSEMQHRHPKNEIFRRIQPADQAMQEMLFYALCASTTRLQQRQCHWLDKLIQPASKVKIHPVTKLE